jgi:predicted MFS family arabinose efflux permease
MIAQFYPASAGRAPVFSCARAAAMMPRLVHAVATPNERVELTPGQERVATAALALAAFALNLNTIVLGAIGPFLPPQVKPAPHSLEWLLASAGLGSALGALAIGPLADRVGRRSPLIAGSIAFVVLSIAQGFADSFALLLALRLLAGAAVGVAYASASALAADLVPYQRRGRTMGSFTAGMWLAVPIGMPIAVWLAKQGHWSWIFFVQAAFAGAGALCAIAAVPRDHGSGSWVAPWNMLGRRPVLAALLAVALHNGPFFVVVQLASGWLDARRVVDGVETCILPKEEQLRLWVVLGLASALGSFVFGRLSDRIGKRNFVLASSILLLLGFGLVDMRLASGWLLLLGLLLAVTAAARTGPLQALTSGLVPSYELGSLMGLRSFAMQVGVVLFAMVAGELEPGHGSGAVLLAAACCQALCYAAVRLGIREGA